MRSQLAVDSTLVNSFAGEHTKSNQPGQPSVVACNSLPNATHEGTACHALTQRAPERHLERATAEQFQATRGPLL